MAVATPGSLSSLHARAQEWTTEWDRALIEAAGAELDGQFDPRESMLKRQVGGEYRYHTALRNQDVHPTRDSFEYALLLLEAGGKQRAERARRIVERTLALQETDADSKWYGLWGYYLEEPAPKMSPADWNWADFNGALLLLIEARHRARLGDDLRRKVCEAIRHAAQSVRRRNVAMTYTNIAVQGTFVTMTAAEVLGDEDLKRYALNRLHRFAKTVDATGSFAEYNSPTYANVTIANLTRIRMLLKGHEALPLIDKIHHRAWQHLGKHWHAPAAQLAGPMSRCYRTDIGAPLWIQKALGGRLAFATLEDIRGRRVLVAGEVGVLDYRCPEGTAGLFLRPGEPRQHRELFLPAEAPVRPVQGTTWLEGDFCLGSANRSDFWVQRRGLLAYWGGRERPARYLQVRFMKDDYDFASALLYAVQEKNYVLGAGNFRSPGGDKHPGLDPVQDGKFSASRLRLRFDLAGVKEGARILADGEPVGLPKRWTRLPRLAIDLGGAKLWLQVRRAVFGDRPCELSVDQEDGLLAVSVDLLRTGEPVTVRWSEIQTAYAAFTLAMEGAEGSLEKFDRHCAALGFDAEAGTTTRLAWKTPSGELGITVAITVGSAADQDRAFSETLNGRPVPVVRLTDERLV